MRFKAIIGLTAASLFVQGCGSIGNSVYGPKRPFQAGYMGNVKSCPGTSPDNFLEDKFVKLACISADDPFNDSKAREMMEASFALTNAQCTDFFAQKAGTQATVETIRSSVAPVLTLLTGVLSIVNFKNDVNGSKRADWEKLLSLSSTATLAGLTVFEQQFLFSADNIDDVRELTMQALSQYKISVRNLQGHTFYTSVDYVLGYHMNCTPGKIKSLVKQAIKDKKVNVIDRNSGASVAPAIAPAATQAGANLIAQ